METEIIEPRTVQITEDAPATVTPAAPAAAPAPTPPTPAVAPAAAAEPAPDSSETAVANLKRQLAEKNEETQRLQTEALTAAAGREEAERRAVALGGTAAAANAAAADAQYDSVITGINACQGELDGYKEAIAKATADGDYGKVADLSVKIGRVSARMERLEDAKIQFEATRKNGAPPQPAAGAPQQQTLDWNAGWTQAGFEVFLQSRTPASAAWLRKQPRFATDVAFRKKVAGADTYIADTLGVQRDSPQYFGKLEELLGMKSATEPQPEPQPQPQPAPAAAPAAAPSRPAPAAPPSRTVPSTPGNGSSPTEITLSPEERRMAHQQFTKETSDFVAKGGDPEVAFAMQKSKLIAEGKWFGNK